METETFAATETSTHHELPTTPVADMWAYKREVDPLIERALGRHLPVVPSDAHKLFNEALHYAVFPGGKRLRPVLTLLGAELVGGSPRDVLPAAAAVEFLHTSSLVFDDLPCMDDAGERRGRVSLHVRYGEGVAVLVALALMNASYGLVLSDTGVDPARAVQAHGELVNCVGTQGMVAGQFIDLADAATPADNNGDGETRPPDGLCNLKTSALFRLTLKLGAILSGATAKQLEVVHQFADILGEAFQISDDIIDLREDAVTANANARRPTQAFEHGAQHANRRVTSLINEAKEILTGEFGMTRPALLLCALADYIAARNSGRVDVIAKIIT